MKTLLAEYLLSNFNILFEQNFLFRLNIGECFIDVTDDEAHEYIQRHEKKYNEELKKLYVKYESNKKRLNDLKIILYAKFGKAIHLEED